MNPWISRRYPVYKNSEDEMIGALPAEWETKQVRRVLKDGRDGIRIGPFGSALKLEDLAEDGICVYGQENVIGRSFSLGKRYITEERFSELKAYEARGGDLLITMMGTSGKCTIVPNEARKGIIDSHLLRLRVRPDAVLPEYFRLLIDECYEIAAQILVAGKGSIMHGLNSAIVKSLVLPIPSTAEQRTILNFLDYETAKIDALIEKQQQLIASLKEKRQAVISHAVTKGLNPDAPMRDSGVEWLGEVPAHWRVGQLRRWIREMEQGKSPECESRPAEGNEWGVLKTGCVNGGVFAQQENKALPAHLTPVEKYEVQAGDVLMSRASGSTELIGSVAFVESTRPKILLSDKIFRLHFESSVDGRYFTSLMASSYMRSSIVSVISGAEGMANNITKPAVLAFPAAIPPIDEQRAIAAHIEDACDHISELTTSASLMLELLNERRTALISAAVTGKIDVRGWKPLESKPPTEAA